MSMEVYYGLMWSIYHLICWKVWSKNKHIFSVWKHLFSS